MANAPVVRSSCRSGRRPGQMHGHRRTHAGRSVSYSQARKEGSFSLSVAPFAASAHFPAMSSPKMETWRRQKSRKRKRGQGKRKSIFAFRDWLSRGPPPLPPPFHLGFFFFSEKQQPERRREGCLYVSWRERNGGGGTNPLQDSHPQTEACGGDIRSEREGTRYLGGKKKP